MQSDAAWPRRRRPSLVHSFYSTIYEEAVEKLLDFFKEHSHLTSVHSLSLSRA